MKTVNYNDSIFINCPFDDKYKLIFNALVFAIFDCGFIARCALEYDDSSVVRMDKIYKMISECRYGIHDISRVQIDSKTKLPRFNMPLELGVFLGAKKFGSTTQTKKQCLIIDKDRYRYHKFISDIGGQDIKAHNNKPDEIIKVVRNWLRNASGRVTLPGVHIIIRRYKLFKKFLPQLSVATALSSNDINK